jgi:inner membrane transporter RhtA
VEKVTRRQLASGNGTWMLVVSIVSVQLGAGFADRLMDHIGPAGAVLMRQGGAAIVLLAVSRPARRGRTRDQWATIVAFGMILAIMNVTFYAAVQRLPLGVAVTIELLGPLGLAAALSRHVTELVWVGVALSGVAVLGEGDRSLDPAGIGFALVAAGCWATYILLSRRTGQQSAGIDDLALAMSVAALAVAPVGLRAGGELLSPHSLGIGALVALLAALVPFSLELVALRRVPPRVFGVVMSLSPVAATFSGFVLLGQHLTPLQFVAMAAVIVASIATVRSAAKPAIVGDDRCCVGDPRAIR